MKIMSKTLRSLHLLIIIIAIFYLCGCGGGSGDSGANTHVYPTSVTLKGKLMSSVTSLALSGIVVTVQNTTYTGTSDDAGIFEIQNVPGGPQTLAFSNNAGDSIGTQSVTLDNANADLGNISLSTDGNPPTPPVLSNSSKSSSLTTSYEVTK